MWYVFIAVLTVFFMKIAIDDIRTPPKYLSKNYTSIKTNATRNEFKPSPQYVSVLNLPKDNFKESVSRAVILSYKKLHFDGPIIKESAEERIAEKPETPIAKQETSDTKENTQNKILAMHSPTSSTLRQSAIEAMSMKFKIIDICESGLKHYNQDGTIVEGEKHPADKGILQINFSAHKKEIREFETQFGISVKTPEGNIKFGEWLYQKEGLRPWNASRSCWEPILWKLGYHNLS